MEAADPLLGTEVHRFKLVRLIGRGGMGRVYEGVRADIGSRVAIKVIAEQYAHEAEHADRFFAEARAVNMIRHDGIVNIFDLDRLPDGRPVIVMEYVEGDTLRHCMRAGKLPLGGVVVVIAQVLEALSAAHAIGIVHRDLKPDNIMVMPSGRTKVLDFGIAKLLSVPEGARAPRTRTGVVIGTPEYMAPEQIDEGLADPRTDIYAMGIVMYEAITGRRPFEGPSDYAIMRAQVEAPIPSIREVRGDVPRELEDVITTALAKRPVERYRSARAMNHALSHAVMALPENQWRPLVPGGVVMRGAVSIPPGEPSPGESLPTARRVVDAGVPTGKHTPRARDEDSDVLRSGHRTVDAPRPKPSDATVETRPNRPDAANVTTRPSRPRAAEKVEPAPARRTRLRNAAIGVGVLGIAAGAVTMWMLPTSGGKPAPAVVHDATPVSIDAQIAIDAAPSGATPVPDTHSIEAPPDAGTKRAGSGHADKSAKQSPVDAGVRVDRVDAEVAIKKDQPERPAAPPDKFNGPMPDKYKSIPGVTIENDATYATVARVRLEEPFTDLSKLDPVAYVATAKQMARKFESDAELTQLSVLVRDNGKLERGPQYFFASAQAHASKDKGRLACISVDVQPWGKPIVQAQWGAQTGCATWKGTRAPKCTLAKIIARAPQRAPSWELKYRDATWSLYAEGEHIADIADDC